ncbi:MAG: MBL fold metallo-hydrolase [Planctomycetaceae bacterium]
MRLELLGTGGYFPNERRHTACVLLPEVGVMFDAGTGAFRVADALQSPELRVFLSHAHLDHVFGLTALLVPLIDGRLTSCRIHGPKPALDAVCDHLFAEPMFPIHPAFEYVELTAEEALPGDGRLTHTPLTHPGGSLGYRADWPDRSLAYITDTVCDGSYAEFVRGVDVLIHECYFPDERAKLAVETGHSHTTPVAELARDAGVGRLILVHTDPLNAAADPIGLPVARTIFPQTELADDGMLVDF